MSEFFGIDDKFESKVSNCDESNNSNNNTNNNHHNKKNSSNNSNDIVLNNNNNNNSSDNNSLAADKSIDSSFDFIPDCFVDLVPVSHQAQGTRGVDYDMICCDDESNNKDLVSCTNSECKLCYHRKCLKTRFNFNQSEIARISRKRSIFSCPYCTLKNATNNNIGISFVISKSNENGCNKEKTNSCFHYYYYKSKKSKSKNKQDTTISNGARKGMLGITSLLED